MILSATFHMKELKIKVEMEKNITLENVSLNLSTDKASW